MVKKEDLTLIVITTPHIFHFEQIKFCLENDKHVHVDKPPVLHFIQAQELVMLAEKKKLLINVHSQRRFYEEYIYAKNCVESGKLGKVEFVQGDFGQQLFDDFKGSWRSNPELAGGGIMIDSGYHILDSILYILGQVKIKSVMMLSNNGEHQSDAFATLTFKTAQNSVVTLNVIRGLPQQISIERVQIVGSKGWILISRDKIKDVLTLTIEHYTSSGTQVKVTTEKIVTTDKIAPLKNLLNALLKKEKLISDLKGAMESVKILEAGYKSVENNQVITL
jgi:predicted dehydrogenase